MKVFLSYSSVDAALARQLAADLRPHADVWMDQWRLGIGDNFVQGIERAIGEADFLILLVTRASVASEWVDREWRTKIEVEERTRRISVIPVIAEDCALPDFLAQRTHTNISGGSYPLGFARLLEILSYYSVDPAPDATAPILPDQKTRDYLPIVVPTVVEVSADLVPFVKPAAAGANRFLDVLVPSMRRRLRTELGIPLPGVRVRRDPDLPAGYAKILIEEIPEKHLEVPATPGAPALLVRALARVLRRKADLFVDIDITRWLADSVARTDRELVERAVPGAMSWSELTDVLRRLLAERIGVGDLRSILQACTERQRGENTAMLAERARHALRPQIIAKLRRGDGPLRALALHAEIETLLAARVVRGRLGSRLHLQPSEAASILGGVRARQRAPGRRGGGFVLLAATPELRLLMRGVVGVDFPELPVLSRADLDPDVPLEVVGEVHLDRSDGGARS